MIGEKRHWDDLFQEASDEVERWRRANKKATLTEIENTLDGELAKMRARIVQDLAMESSLADLTQLTGEERPRCPQCGQALVANGRQERELTTEHEQSIRLSRSKAYCPQCRTSHFPPG